MKKKIILSGIVITTTLLAGCGNNSTQNSQYSEKLQQHQKNQQMQQVTQKQQINQNKKNEEKVGQKTQKEVGKEKFVFITPKTCGRLCKEIQPEKTFKNIKFESKIIEKPIPGVQNAYPIIYTNNLEGVAKIVSTLIKRPVQAKDLTPEVLKTLGVEKKDGYYIHLGVEAIGKENYCNDGIDNDGDGKIDLKDMEDCKQVVVYYDSKADKVYNKDAIKEYLKVVMPVGFNYKFIDYEKNKNIYIDLLKKMKKNIYLPVFFIQDFPDYYPVYIDTLKKHLNKINYILNEGNKEVLFKYIRTLSQGWDPIKKTIHINTFNKTGKLDTKDLEFFNKEAILINPNSDINLVIWSAGLCPYCKKLFNNLFNSGIINEFGGITVVEFPLPSLHGNIDNDIAVFNKCVSENIKDDKTRLNILKTEYDTPHTNINKYFDLINDKVQRELVKKCYDTRYKEILKEIQKKVTETAQKYGINGTPFLLMYNKKTGDYGTVPGFVPNDLIKQAIINIKEMSKKDK